MGNLFKADTPKVAKAPTSSQSGGKSNISVKKLKPQISTKSIYGNIDSRTANALAAMRGIDPTVNYTPINTGRVPSLVGSSTFDFIRGQDPTGLNAGGLTAGYDNGAINLNSSPFRNSQVQGIVDQYNAQFADLEQQRGTVAPGYSNFRQSALQRLDDSRKKALSNLRDNMARRGVLGSSFGEDAVARQDLEYQREAERINTEAYLKEIDLTNQLSNQQYQAGVKAYETGLNELNFQSDIAAKLTSQADQFLSQTNAILGDLAKADAGNQTSMAMADADNQLKAQMAQLDAEIARASGIAKTELEGMRSKLEAQYQINQQKLAAYQTQNSLRMQQSLANAGNNTQINVANANNAQGAYNMQYKQQATQDAGIGSLLGMGASIAAAPFTGGLSLAALPSFAA